MAQPLTTGQVARSGHGQAAKSHPFPSDSAVHSALGLSLSRTPCGTQAP